MKKYIYIIIWLLSPIFLSAQNNITQAQYWFDGQYSTEVTQNVGPTADLTLNEMIDVTGLINGLHTVTYRFKDNRGVWGSVLTKFFTCYQGTGTPGIHEITEIEYWYDANYTNATKVSIGPGSTLQVSELLDVAALGNGLHTICFRFKDDRNIWGAPQTKFFTKNQSTGIHEIVKLEYWYDDDYENAIQDNVVATTSFDINENLDISGLSIGVHTVNYRFQDDSGKWSPVRSWMFHNIPSQNGTEMYEVVAMEYWFNGNRLDVQKSSVSSNGTFTLETSLDISSLNHGLHYVSYRFLDDAGNWSSAVSKFFSNYPEAESPEMHPITALEYWFDGDYSAVANEDISATETFELDKQLSVSALNQGLHIISYRFQDETGNWSSVVSKMFSHSPEAKTVEMHEIVEYQYWFDGGNSSLINIPVANEQVLAIEETLDIKSLNEGLHIISHRFKDKSGTWSSAVSNFFSYYEDEILPSDNKIVGYRYWADDNIASATLVTLTTPTKTLVLDELIDVSNFPSGEHMASFQFVDAQDHWSNALSQTYSKTVQPYVEISADDSIICLGTPIIFSADITDADEIEWKFGDGETSFEFTPEHTYVQSGSYEVTAIVTHIDSAKSAYDTIVGGITIYPVYNVTDDKEICASEVPFIFGTQSLTSSGEYTEIFQTAAGCDSTVVLTLTVNPEYETPLEESICQGESYLFGTERLTTGGTYKDTRQTINGCDSVIVLDLTVNPTFEIPRTASICEGNTYEFGGEQLTEANTYYDSLQTINGCDSVLVLTLTVYPTYETPIEASICDGDNYNFGGELRTVAGTYKDTLQSASTCDSVVVLTLNINPVYETPIDSAICDGESVNFAGEILSATGIYKDTVASINGCDSVIVLTLTVNPVYNETATASICEGDNYMFGGIERTISGDYTHIFTSINGCDSTVILTLNVSRTIEETINKAICDGDVYAFGGFNLATTGEYKDTLNSTSGCDSIAILNLTVNPVFETVLEASICEGDDYTFAGKMRTIEGTYKDTLQSVYNCDSVIVLNLTVLPVFEVPLNINICEGENYLLGAKTLMASGIYKDTLQTANSCDSVIILNLAVHSVYNKSTTDTICDGDTYLFGDQTLTSSGIYAHTFETAHGCDSAVTLTLTVNPVYNEVVAASICKGDSYIFDIDTLYIQGNYDYRYLTVNGCDSVITLALTVNPTFDIDVKVNIEDNEFPYLFGSTSIDTAGLYKDTFQTVFGCDSVVTLYLNIADEVPPVAKCNSINIALERNGKYSLTQNDLEQLSAGSTDDVSDYKNLKIKATPSEFTCSDVGNVKVKLSITDEGGNQDMCETTVSVSNNYPIQIMKLNDIEVILPNGVCDTKIDYPYIGAIGPCVSFSQIEGLGPNGTFPTGITNEVWLATNTSGDTATLNFNVIVISENKAPTIHAIADTNTSEDIPILINLTGISNGGDCFENKVSLSVSDYNSGLISAIAINYIEGSNTGSLEVIPVENLFGTSNITIEVEDSEGAKTSESFTLTVNPVNDAPVLIRAVPNHDVDANGTLDFSLSKLLGVLFDDVDNDSLSYTIRFEDGILPDWISATENADMFTLNFAPLQADTGCYNIEINAIDPGGLMAADTFEFCVNKILVGIEDLNNEVFEVNLYPNPSKGPVSIDINTTFVGELEVIVMNIAGSQVFRKKYQTNEPVRFDLSNHVSGTYMAIIKIDNKRVVKKFILDRK